MELKIKDIKPLYNMLVTTCDMYEDDSVTESGLIKEQKAKSLKEIQKVLKVGPNVTGIKEGDYVYLKFKMMQKQSFTEKEKRDQNSLRNINVEPVYQLDTTLIHELNDQMVLFLYQNQVEDYIVTDFEYIENKKPSVILKPDKGVSSDFIRKVESGAHV